MQNLGRLFNFTQLLTLIANIFGKTQDIQDWTDVLSRSFPSIFGKTSPVNFGPLSRK